MSYSADDAYWAVNPRKVERAIKVLLDSKQEINEETVRALYLKYGGAVVGEPDTFLGVPNDGKPLLIEDTPLYEKGLEKVKKKKAK